MLAERPRPASPEAAAEVHAATGFSFPEAPTGAVEIAPPAASAPAPELPVVPVDEGPLAPEPMDGEPAAVPVAVVPAVEPGSAYPPPPAYSATAAAVVPVAPVEQPHVASPTHPRLQRIDMAPTETVSYPSILPVAAAPPAVEASRVESPPSAVAVPPAAVSSTTTTTVGSDEEERGAEGTEDEIQVAFEDAMRAASSILFGSTSRDETKSEDVAEGVPLDVVPSPEDVKLLGPTEWAPDGGGYFGEYDALECKVCKGGFGLMRRKHHCRNCGHLVCSRCSPVRWPKAMLPQAFNPRNEKQLRICNVCMKSTETFRQALLDGDLAAALNVFRRGYVRTVSSPYSIYPDAAFPLHCAAQGGNVALTRWLMVDMDCAADARDKSGRAPIEYAANAGNLEMMRFLAMNGAEASQITNVEVLQTALHMALTGKARHQSSDVITGARVLLPEASFDEGPRRLSPTTVALAENREAASAPPAPAATEETSAKGPSASTGSGAGASPDAPPGLVPADAPPPSYPAAAYGAGTSGYPGAGTAPPQLAEYMAAPHVGTVPAGAYADFGAATATAVDPRTGYPGATPGHPGAYPVNLATATSPSQTRPGAYPASLTATTYSTAATPGASSGAPAPVYGYPAAHYPQGPGIAQVPQYGYAAPAAPSAASGPLKEEDECVICFERPKSCVFVPCGHICACERCAESVARHACPVCRAPVERVVRTYR